MAEPAKHEGEENLSSIGWSEAEVLATVDDYFSMLELELRGEPYVKTAHRRNLLRLLDGRNEAAVELKHRNISAILLGAGAPTIDGYKPLRNYQRLLADVVLERLVASKPLLDAIRLVSAEMPLRRRPWSDTTASLQVAPPEHIVREKPPDYGSRLLAPSFDFAGRDARNRKLGEMGEAFVLEVERRRLTGLGRRDLARKIEWVARDRDVAAGYDIRSFDEAGEDLFLEVKTTNLTRRTPFFVSRNELRVSKDKAEIYRLFRIFQFSRDPHFFVLNGAIDENCVLEPRSYAAFR